MPDGQFSTLVGSGRLRYEVGEGTLLLRLSMALVLSEHSGPVTGACHSFPSFTARHFTTTFGFSLVELIRRATFLLQPQPLQPQRAVSSFSGLRLTGLTLSRACTCFPLFLLVGLGHRTRWSPLSTRYYKWMTILYHRKVPLSNRKDRRWCRRPFDSAEPGGLSHWVSCTCSGIPRPGLPWSAPGGTASYGDPRGATYRTGPACGPVRNLKRAVHPVRHPVSFRSSCSLLFALVILAPPGTRYYKMLYLLLS